MATYFMFGRFSMDAVKEISKERTVKATAAIKSVGGEVKSAYALLGEKDLVLIVDFPGLKEAMKASVELTKLLGISFTTAPAVTVEEFDKLVTG
ncbi:MAG: GYD domain-containing protein [Anaerolineales bacterium]